uniref:SHSP domain-containing protein n=1 Tax=Kalanchoe fedtschenkoi TaxID=63787 RepID=A0A7N0V1M0_KALFE
MASTEDYRPSHKWMVEDDGRHAVQLYVPGYTEEEMRVNLIGDMLTITRDKKLDGSQTNERPNFKVTFPLSRKCSSKDFDAKLTNGYLKITLPPNTTGEQKVHPRGDLSFDKRLAAMVAAAVIVASGLAVAFRHLLFNQV